MQLTNLTDRIHSTILNNLSEQWVSDTYNWQQDFLCYYFTYWFDTISQCLHAIDNNAEHLLGIMKWNEQHNLKPSIYTTVLNFELYIYSFAEYELNHNYVIIGKIHDIINLQRVKKMVPLVVNRILLPVLKQRITSYLY